MASWWSRRRRRRGCRGTGKSDDRRFIVLRGPTPMNLRRTARHFAELLGAVAPTQGGLPTGGTSAQVLAKASGTDYDTHWADGSAYDPNAVYALRLASGAHVNHGVFWPRQVEGVQADLDSAFFWDAWVAPS